MSRPKLWSWHLSPFAGKVRVACAEKGVEVELLEIDPRDRPARLREINVTATVPVLELDGLAVRESSAICDWLEETHPAPARWPSDALARAAGRGLMRWVDDELTRNFFLSMRKETFGVDRSDHPEIVDILRRRLVKRWPEAERLLAHSEGPWLLAGEEPSFADLSAQPIAVRLNEWRPDLGPDAEAHPLTCAWLARLRERPSAAEVSRRGEPVPAG